MAQTPVKKTEEISTSLKRVAREYTEILLLALLLAIFIRAFVVSVYRIPNIKMAPTLFAGDIVIGNKFSFSKFASEPLEQIKRGDILIFQCPGIPDRNCVSRVVGLPGDQLIMHRGQLTVNGEDYSYRAASAIDPEWGRQPHMEDFEVMEESWSGSMGRQIITLKEGELDPQRATVSQGEIFFLSDFRASGDGSFQWGAVNVESVEAQVKWVLLSFSWPIGGLEKAWLPNVRWNRTFREI